MRTTYRIIVSLMMVSLATTSNINISMVHGQEASRSVIENGDPIYIADNTSDVLSKGARRSYDGNAPVQGAPLVMEDEGALPPAGLTDGSFAPPLKQSADAFKANGGSFQPLGPVKQPVPQSFQLNQEQTIGAQVGPIKPVSIQNQGPAISTQIEAPSYINLNQPAKLRIKLVNSGDAPAANVKLLATIPGHVRFASSNPAPTDVQGQVYEFQIPGFAARQTREVVIDLIPQEKKAIDIGTEIIVENIQRFSVGVREPKIKISLQGPTETHLGQNITHKVFIENTGDGQAEDVELLAIFPNELRCEKKNSVAIPVLEPGQRIEVEIPSIATGAGQAELAVSVAALGLDSQTVKSGIRVFEPELEISAAGPQVNFLNREGIYTIKIDNTGEVDASNVTVDLKVPSGMRVTTISHQAKLNPGTGILTWTFDRIAAQSEQTIKLITVATGPGQQDCVFTVRSQQTRDQSIYLTTNVISRPELSIKLQNQTGPIQVGGKVQLLVVVENTGSSTASDLNVAVELPDSLVADAQDGVDLMSIGNNIRFAAAQLEAGQKREFQFTVVAHQAGEHVVRTTLNSAGSERQLVSEGVAFVYEINENRVSETLSPAVVR